MFVVTILAIVFIPVSLASSIFGSYITATHCSCQRQALADHEIIGMNVQQINKTGHSIWAFVITAFIMLLISGLSFAVWRSAHNMRLLAQYTHRHKGEEWYSEMGPRLKVLKSRLGLMNWTLFLRQSTFERWLIYLGLRRVEKAGIEGV